MPNDPFEPNGPVLPNTQVVTTTLIIPTGPIIPTVFSISPIARHYELSLADQIDFNNKINQIIKERSPV